MAGFFVFKTPMDREFKAFPYFDIKGDTQGRIRKGICAVFGNVDAGGDRISPGAFAKTISEGRSRVKHLWNHDFSTPPIASITELKEVSRDELPPSVLEYAPEAKGGLMVAREYYKTDLADWVLQAIDKGDVSEMSFGYNVIRDEKSSADGQDIRELKELMLLDTSDVNWGMNSATVGIGAKNIQPIGVLINQLQFYADDVKAGRRNNHIDQTLINGLHDISLHLGCDSCGKDTPKSDEAAAVHDTALSSRRRERMRLQLEL